MEERESKLKTKAMKYWVEANEAYVGLHYRECIALLQKAIQLFKLCGEDAMCGHCMNYMGVAYSDLGDDNMEIDCFLDALDYVKEKQIHSVMGPVYNNIGSRYQSIGDQETAIHYFQLSLEQEYGTNEEEQQNYYMSMLAPNLNMVTSYQKMGELQMAGQYLEEAERLMEEHDLARYEFPLLVVQCITRWNEGDREYVEGQLDRLIEVAAHQDNLLDYQENVEDIAEFLKEIEAYDHWKRLLDVVEENIVHHKAVPFLMAANEMWMDYYRTIGDEENFKKACVEHVELYQRKKEHENQRRGEALDIRIALRKEAEERRQAEHLSRTDALTKLGNRYSMEQEMKQVVQRAQQDEHRIAVGILDVDNFKQINDTYGHTTGDETLRFVAGILHDAVDGYGSVFRYGGDEFVVVMPEGDYGGVGHVAEAIARRLAEAAVPNEASDVSDVLTVSQGYACFLPKPEQTSGEMLELADKALYQVKKNGKNGYQIIVPEEDGQGGSYDPEK